MPLRQFIFARVPRTQLFAHPAGGGILFCIADIGMLHPVTRHDLCQQPAGPQGISPSPVGRVHIIADLAAFLLGHILYALWAFSRLQAGFALWSLLSLLPVTAACVWLLVRLWSRLGGMKLPVCGYCLVIGLMTGCALCAFFSRPALASAVFALGAMLFLVSDAALALGRFGTPRPHQGFLVMTTYILAQFFISLAPILS